MEIEHGEGNISIPPLKTIDATLGCRIVDLVKERRDLVLDSFCTHSFGRRLVGGKDHTLTSAARWTLGKTRKLPRNRPVPPKR